MGVFVQRLSAVGCERNAIVKHNVVRGLLFLGIPGVATGLYQPVRAAEANPQVSKRSNLSLVPSDIQNVEHVIWTMQEIHSFSFDNCFGTFPGADGLPPSMCLLNYPDAKRVVAPFHPYPWPERVPHFVLDTLRSLGRRAKRRYRA